MEEFRAWLGSSTAPSHPMIAPSPPRTPSTVRTPRHRRRAPIEPLPAPIVRLAEFLNAAASAEPPELEEWPRLLPTAEESSLRWSMPAEAPSFTRRSTLKPVKTVKRLSTLPLLSGRDVPKPLPREPELAEARFGGELASFFDRIDEAYAYDAETSRLRRLGWGGKILRVKAAKEAEVAQKAQEKAQAGNTQQSNTSLRQGMTGVTSRIQSTLCDGTRINRKLNHITQRYGHTRYMW